MGNVLGIIYNNRDNNLKKKYEPVNTYCEEKKKLPIFLSYDSKINQYFLQLKYIDNKISLYKDNIVDDKESFERKLNSILLKKVKDYGKQIQNNIYIYDNNIYKFKKFNNINIINDIYKLNIKNILIPKYIYSKRKNNQYLEIYDYFENGDLFNYLFEKKNIVSFNDKINIFKKIVKIIEELHQNDYTHRDIKCENILVDIDSNGEVQPILIDLDYAMKSYQYLHFRGGTALYAAPEMMYEQKSSYSFKSTDIWSLGVLFYIIIYEEPLWLQPHINDDNFYIYNSFIKSNPDKSYWNEVVNENNQKYNISENDSLKIKNVLDFCLNINYYDRTNVSKIFDILNV